MVTGYVDAAPVVRTEAAYDALLATARASIATDLPAQLRDVLRVLAAWREADRALSGRAEMAQLPALSDMQAQLARLVHPGFIGEAGPAQLWRVPTWLSALGARRTALDTSGTAVNRDRSLMDSMRDVQEAYLHAVAALPEGRPPGAKLRQARWMLEELRVSLWAQQLGTPYPVSDQRIRKVLAG